jgi:dTDP-4-dehydrorhamnose reductase
LKDLVGRRWPAILIENERAMHLLVLGGSGQLGSELRALVLPSAVQLTAPPRSTVDLTDAATIEKLIASEPWSGVINASGYTNVDRAEREEALAFAINAEAAGRLAAATETRGIPLIQVSTDYVFDGRKGAPYVEADAAQPLNVYGRSKLAGERQISATNPRHVILRTAWLFSPFGNNFVRTILRLAKERERLRVVTDQLGCPTAARDLAKACLHVALCCATAPDHAPYGTYHFAGAEAATWFEFANATIDHARSRLVHVPHVEPITTAQYLSPAARPADSRLNCGAIAAAFELKPPSWQSALADTVQRLLA